MAQLTCEVSEGLRKAEATVMIRTFDGRREFLPVDREFLTREGNKYFLPVGLIHTSEGENAALIELPSEADSGANRVWVRLDHLRLTSETVR